MVNMATSLNSARHVADWKTVFHHIFALSEIRERKLMPRRNVVGQTNAAAKVNGGSSGQRLQRNCHIISLVDSDILCHRNYNIDLTASRIPDF